MNIRERRAEIMLRLAKHHMVSVAQLGRDLNVSEMTVRRDLAELERMGYARRTHGGAIHETQRSFEPAIMMRYGERAAAKQRIAAAAVRLCAPGDSIAIDVGSTMMYLAEELRDATDLRLIVITPSMSIGGELSENPSYLVIVTGGQVRRGELTLTGALAEAALSQFHFRTLFLSAAGMSASGGLTEFNMEDAAVKRAMIASAERVVALVDSSKFGHTKLCSICTYDEVDVLVTDAPPTGDLRDTLRAHSVEIIVADAGDITHTEEL
ncbi:MAG: DeoR/GlpR family DNA-binding transcription regulator [Alkalispirochaeta sp.]